MKIIELFETINVNSSSFKKWFGDSKIVDKSGKPLKLYRGLNGTHIQNTTMEPRNGYAIFFTTSPYMAATYANPPEKGNWNDAGAIFQVYIKANKLYEFPTRETKYGKSFDKLEFDNLAKKLKPNEALVVRNIIDVGPRCDNNIDPDKLWSYPADVYAIGKGTEIKSAISDFTWKYSK